MQKRWLTFVSVTLCAVLMVLHPGTANGTGDRILMRQLKETIEKVRTGVPSSIARTDMAQHLAELTRKIDPKMVDDKTLADIVSLLDTQDDSVRAWVAASLGNLGPRARISIPSLLKILPEVDCIPNIGMTSAPFIRTAISRMGVKPPPPPACKTTKK